MIRSMCYAILCVASVAAADTTWVGGGDVQGLWTVADSPYMIQADIRIASAATLSINAGVEVICTGQYVVTVDGTLAADGAPGDSIRFTRLRGDTLHRWGGLQINQPSLAAFRYCVFDWMTYTGGVAGIMVSNTLSSFSHCTVQRNLSRAMLVTIGHGVMLDDCDFIGNGTPGNGAPGAALFLQSNASAWATRCRFIGNGAVDGGAMQCNSGSLLVLDHCIFHNNHAGIWGGAIFGEGALVATQCTFVGNRAQSGSHIQMWSEIPMQLNSCIFANSRYTGGALYVTNVVPDIHHCSFFGNQPIFFSNSAVPQGFGTTNRQNSHGTPCDRYANIFVDPLFADTSVSDLDLLPTSPCVNAADSNLVRDDDGSPPDIGAASVYITDSTFVCGDVSGIWDSTGSPYIVTCDLLVDSLNTLQIGPGVRVQFMGHYTFEVRGLILALGSVDDSILFTIDTLAYPDRWDGIRLDGAGDSSRFEYCRIEHAFSLHSGELDGGGGLHIQDCSPTVSHCWFLRNRGARNGSGLSAFMSNMQVSDCRFTGNRAIYGGGAIFAYSYPTVSHCIFEYNVANQGGGIGFWWDAGPVINCTFVGNHGDDAGGIRVSTNASPQVTNCLFVNNTGRAAIALYETVEPGIMAYNCFFGNPQPVYSLDLPLPPDIGINTRVNVNGDSCDPYFNLQLDPHLTSLENGDYSLTRSSPCIDAGDPQFPRDPNSSIADIGALAYLFLPEWFTIEFPGGFAGLGCPCSYPFQLPEGSLVRLRRDELHDGPTPDDDVAAQFAVSAGAGLPPWGGYWTPRPESPLIYDAYYVELLTNACCWFTDSLRITERDTVIVPPAAWHCQDGGVNGGCLSTAPTALAAISPPPEPLLAVPNPFNAVTELRFALTQTQRVDLVIYDLTGREVARLAHGDYDAGTHHVRFDGTNLATGIYFVSFRHGSNLTVRKLLLLK